VYQNLNLYFILYFFAVLCPPCRSARPNVLRYGRAVKSFGLNQLYGFGKTSRDNLFFLRANLFLGLLLLCLEIL
jgi:hypothetical protein